MRYLILSLCILVSCANKASITPKESENQDLLIIDVTKEYPVKVINVQDIADVEYIPLETNDSTLIEGWFPDAVSEKYIVYHNRNGQVNVFNRKGKSLYSFSRRGGSNEEYNSIHDIVLDEEKKELYIVEPGLYSKIFVYSLDGTFKRKFVLPAKHKSAYLLDYDENFLICYNNYYSDAPWQQLDQKEIELRDNPYYFISKTTGDITPLNYYIPNRIGNQLHLMRANGDGLSYQANIEPIVKNGSEIIISEFADDTIYSLKDKKLSPIMVKNPSAHKFTPPMMVAVEFFTDRYVSINILEKIFDGTKPKKNSMVYDRHLKEFCRLALLNKDYTIKRAVKGPVKDRCALPRNTIINVLYAENLIKDNEAGKLGGKLKHIASKLKEDDNPVLMLIKFKE